MSVLEQLRYSREHEWVKIEGTEVRIGVTHFAQVELGDIVFVELPKVGDIIRITEPFGNIESVKTVSELYAPVSGTVVEVNQDLIDNPEFVNESPYEKAWMIVVRPTDINELENLLTAEQYNKLTNEV
ncbi:glycine cleavage system protein GcvH [Metabacillus fastidiosus]|uniref:Glycine cleavage system H protein n=1 Tax=Metabacillus fastidiosus TaxID=1458 RepID=A0ABU6P1B8_9BACI|nr:glycine cleavage system protein GcvH [Metabacillus fastidiosus]MED4402309.1 glycine cleavage system protein GcvH [Metabacillus fastidiosus]MED4462180.1 glycine cleavage system protein GcvH [Metabacillus fastidiosus]